MKKLTKDDFFRRLEYFNVSRDIFINQLKRSYSNQRRTLDTLLLECYNYGDLISRAFTWSNTPQGHHFWSNIYDNIDRIEIPYIKKRINKIKIK